MPIYAYLCGQCGFRKDVLQKLSDAPLTLCPHCGAEAFAKQLSAPSFQLKGTGWYATDFKNSGKPPSPAPSSSGEAAPAAAPAAAETASAPSSSPAAPAAA
ncbi:MAG: zinc ribbon domain-containing protein [Comamonadaceae bacterium]|nr:zinc ribbon domain-containing protein [Comamonadaceae bacterium]